MKSIPRLFVILCLCALGTAPVFATPPNVLFIAIDDLKPMLGCYDDPDVLSPNIDRLAERGTVFLNNACQQAICGPSRASLMTGLYPDSTRVFDLQTRMRDVNPSILTLPEYFQKQGYATTGTGKIYDPRCVDQQLDAPSWSIPYRRSTAGFYSKATGAPYNGFHDPRVRVNHQAIKKTMQAEGVAKENAQAYKRLEAQSPDGKPVFECLEVNVPDDAYHDGAVLNSVLDQLEGLTQSDQPFFLGVGFSKPHLPFVAPKKYWDMYDRDAIQLAPFEQMPEGAPEYAFQPSWELRSYSGVPAPGPVLAVELYDYRTDSLETVNQALNPEYRDIVDHFERLFKERGLAQEESFS